MKFSTWSRVLDVIKFNTEGLLELHELNIGDKEIGDLGEKLKNNTKVFHVYIPGNNTISTQGFKTLADNIKLRKEPLTVECNNHNWNKIFRLIHDTKNSSSGINHSDTLNRSLLDLVQFPDKYLDIIKYLLESADAIYPYSINTANSQGHTIAKYYTHNLEMQRWLFGHGYIPRGNELLPADHNLRGFANDTQSVHQAAAVKATNFYIKKLLEQVVVSDDELDQAAGETIDTIRQLSDINNKAEHIPFMLSDLSKDRKEDIFEKISENLKQEYLQNNKIAMETIINKVVDVLKNSYIKKNLDGSYQDLYANYRYCYDYQQDKYLQLPRAIGAIKLLIDSHHLTKQEAQELYVSSISKYFSTEKDESNLSNTLANIKKVLNKNDLTIAELQTPQSCHQLLDNNSTTQQQIEQLFKDLNHCSVEDVWKINKMSELAIQLYIAATTYNDGNMSACKQGVMSQIIHTLPKIADDFINELASEQSKIQDTITENNIGEFTEAINSKLIEKCKENNLTEELLDFISCCMDMDFNKTTYKEQKVFAELNKLFKETIREFLPEYGDRHPLGAEYKIMIDILRQTKLMQDFANHNNHEETGIAEQTQAMMEEMKELQQNQEITTLVQEICDHYEGYQRALLGDLLLNELEEWL
ncbi:hypothetical protein [Candidatus Tisiphia endosymbiont of Thecophora atra]|uniref:hypothetical protein n=1 Tax=Candidatus Tisiphia endosymbiont of Thecophora atra TaxID=3066258 RepID=UPI00312C7502